MNQPRRRSTCIRTSVALLATVILLIATPAGASVTITPGAAFQIDIDASESVSVLCNAGVVRVVVNGSPTDTVTLCSAVTSLTVTATGLFDNIIDLQAVANPPFTSLLFATLSGGDGNDTLTGSPLPDVVNGEGGNDTITTPLGDDIIDGGLGTDTLDYTGFGSAVSVNLGSIAPSMTATLGGDQEAPTTSSTATGTATLTYNNLVHVFTSISVAVSGIAPADVTGFHIHRAPFGVNGPVIVDFGTAGLVSDGSGGFTFTAPILPLDPSHEAAFLGGITYIDVHTSVSSGEIRGQLFSSAPFLSASSTATGALAVSSFENAIGGSGSTVLGFGDSIVGSVLANILRGGPGNDTIVGSVGADTIDGDAGDDVMAWNNLDGTDVMDGDTDSDTVQVNGSPTGGDVFAIQAGTLGRVDFDRTSLLPFSLDIGSTETLIVNGIGANDTLAVNSMVGVTDLTAINLNGLAGDDSFNVDPSAGQTITAHGGLPNPPSTPGDTLTVDPTGTTSPALTATSGANGFQGSYTFGNRMPVTFQFIESLPVMADLTVTKDDAPDPVGAGSNITYTITVTNVGGIDASGVTLTDTVPANTTFVSFTAPGGWTPTTPPAGGTGTVTATNPSLAASASAVFILVVEVDSGMAPGTVTNTAAATTTSTESDASNNSDIETTNVTAGTADLDIDKTTNAGPVAPGGPVTYTITVTNTGPADAGNVVVTDVLPAGSTFVSATPSQGSCIGTATVTCTLGTLADGATATITLVINAPSTPGGFSNTATVTTTDIDPTPANDAATATLNAAAGIPLLDPRWLILLAVALAATGAVALKS